ncbi:prephenate dehydratase [Anaerofustis butyriciformans]|uniref:prephenate dehydratase n=1 Tax=Anaerofustis TaxID=264995 RepID=UPI003F8AF83B
MRKLAVLGPKGTFSDNACSVFLSEEKEDFDVLYYNTIDETFHSIGKECDMGIIPIENTLDGFVQRTLDLLLEMDVHIVREISVPVQFSFIGNSENIEQIKKIYVQFKTNGQCRKFLDSLKGVNIITTDSNMESYNNVSKGILAEGGIIPMHMLKYANAKYKIDNVTDASNNLTRFVVVEKGENKCTAQNNKHFKVPMYIMPNVDRPGILFDILHEFSINKINLVAIMSRPTKKDMGKYNFYLEIDGENDQIEIVKKSLDNVKKQYGLKVLGFYSI